MLAQSVQIYTHKLSLYKSIHTASQEVLYNTVYRIAGIFGGGGGGGKIFVSSNFLASS